MKSTTIVATVLAVTAATAVTGAVAAGRTEPPANVAAKADKSSQKPANTLKAGRPYKAGKLDLMVTQVEHTRRVTSGTRTWTSDTGFVVVWVLSANRGRQPEVNYQAASGGLLTTTDGHTYGPATRDGRFLTPEGSEAVGVRPGSSALNGVVFEVPQGKTAQSVQLTPDLPGLPV
ncbi:hypothetical protein ACIBG8_11950 [Nonomuraea sp. NPDC050556]|uniref:hypothetical protein n=1 Tax=Nonomuraea sp. NPDC050556 TaxID=3364369 RepID=UPI0037B52991